MKISYLLFLIYLINGFVWLFVDFRYSIVSFYFAIFYCYFYLQEIVKELDKLFEFICLIDLDFPIDYQMR